MKEGLREENQGNNRLHFMKDEEKNTGDSRSRENGNIDFKPELKAVSLHNLSDSVVKYSFSKNMLVQ